MARHGLFETPSLWFGASLMMNDIDNTTAYSPGVYIVELRSAQQTDSRDSSRHVLYISEMVGSSISR